MIQLLIIFPQSDGALLQSSLAIVRPDKRSIPGPVNHVRIQPDPFSVLGLRLAVVRFDIDMLPQHQALTGLQLHIEGIGAGGVRRIPRIIVIITALTGGILPIYLRYLPLPGLGIIHPRVNQHCLFLHQRAYILLIDRALNLQIPGLHDGKKGRI